MVNDLMIVGKIDKQLREKRPEKDNVFPLSPTHRKELRKLRDSNISGLKERLYNIMKVKKEEFFTKYRDKIENEADKVNPKIDKLNKKFNDMINDLRKSTRELVALEEELGMDNIAVDRDWNDICALEDKHYKREYKKDTKLIKKTLEDMFEKQFGEKFSEVQKKIDKMLEQYEEAINFGDLEIVKELYYQLKDADGFLDSVSKLEV